MAQFGIVGMMIILWSFHQIFAASAGHCQDLGSCPNSDVDVLSAMQAAMRLHSNSESQIGQLRGILKSNSTPPDAKAVQLLDGLTNYLDSIGYSTQCTFSSTTTTTTTVTTTTTLVCAEDDQGDCRRCPSGYGLDDFRLCAPCNVPECSSCIYGNMGACMDCNPGFALQKDGTYPKGTCIACTSSMSNCCIDDGVVCSKCSSGYGKNDQGGCDACPQNCHECGRNAVRQGCQDWGCDPGYGAQKDNNGYRTCVQCASGISATYIKPPQQTRGEWTCPHNHYNPLGKDTPSCCVACSSASCSDGGKVQSICDEIISKCPNMATKCAWGRREGMYQCLPQCNNPACTTGASGEYCDQPDVCASCPHGSCANNIGCPSGYTCPDRSSSHPQCCKKTCKYANVCNTGEGCMNSAPKYCFTCSANCKGCDSREKCTTCNDGFTLVDKGAKRPCEQCATGYSCRGQGCYDYGQELICDSSYQNGHGCCQTCTCAGRVKGECSDCSGCGWHWGLKSCEKCASGISQKHRKWPQGDGSYSQCPPGYSQKNGCCNPT
mmetsp:Transcript_96735/g.167917  ORF Transcript_96735/g.167917 Transcript_96735/m.167917 type:complete len:548 (-) Transcript_96735:83-1726(-)